MTHLACVCIAGMIHWIHKWVSYYEDWKDLVSQLPSILVAIGIMDLIYDNYFIPQAFEFVPDFFKRSYELGVSIFLLEFFMLVVWGTTELILYMVMKIFLLSTGLASEENFTMYEALWVGCVSLPLSLLILAFAGQATDHFNLIHKRGFRDQKIVTLKV
ncbi:hypothetical protein KR009_007647, partial [Drosophila setifemur]